jgi:hypothetical protein
MDELERQLHDYSTGLPVPEPVGADEILGRPSARGRDGRRAFVVAVAVLVVVVLGGAVVALVSGSPGSDDGPVAPVDTITATTSPAPLRARLELPSDRMVAGSTMAGEVVVDNDTGQPIDTISCVSLYGAFLTSERYSQPAAWRTCAQPFRVPIGESRWPVAVIASQWGCALGGAQDGIPPCEGSGTPPPVPAGTYEVRVGSGGDGPPVPDPVTIEVVDP